LTRNSSVLKQIFSTALGVLVGLVSGLALSLELNTPKGSYEFSRAKHRLLDLDIRVVKEPAADNLISNK
jgi:hypothetical protein